MFAAFVTSALVLCGAFRADAQDFRQSFSLSTPGARANAMGQAFIGVADDASAMITNPAGLFQMTRPQAYVEFKSGQELVEDEFHTIESPGAVSFFGVSTPIGGRVAVGFSRHEYFGFRTTVPNVSSDFEASGVSYGGTVAVAATQDLYIGATVAIHSLSFDDGFIGFEQSESTLGGGIGVLWRASPIVSVGVNTAFASEENEDFGELMPNRFGAGAGVRPTPRLLIAADVTWIAYSDLELAEDATQFHMGGEYQLLRSSSNQVFARAGLFTVPDDEFGEDGGVVGTFGAGVALGRHFQADFAVLTEGEVVISAGVRF
jgi:long-subunit fatty acid transport protein